LKVVEKLALKTARVGVWCAIFLAFWSALSPPNKSIASVTLQSPFVLPVVKRDSLLNGLQLITLEQPGTGNVSVHLRINSGALFDLAGKGGLADLTAGMLLRGGGGLDAKNVADTVEHSGLSVNVQVGWDSTDIVISGPSDTLETIFDLINRLVVTPSFDQKEFDDLKAARLAAIKKERTDGTEVAGLALAAVYSTHPFGKPLRGSIESIGKITRPDLLFFHGRYYIANNAEMVVSGDAMAEQVTRLGRARLGAWKKGDRISPTFRAPDATPSRRLVIADRPQSTEAYAAIAQQGFSRRAEDYFAAMVMMDLLTENLSKGGPSGQASLATVDFEPHILDGPILIALKSDPDNLATSIDAALSAMASLQQAAPSAEQVEAAKRRFIQSMSEQLKTPAGAAEVILDIDTFSLGRDYLISFADRLGAVTTTDVMNAARTHLHPQNVAVAASGPAAKLEGSLKKFGNVASTR
jgi:zinc protease